MMRATLPRQSVRSSWTSSIRGARTNHDERSRKRPRGGPSAPLTALGEIQPTGVSHTIRTRCAGQSPSAR